MADIYEEHDFEDEGDLLEVIQEGQDESTEQNETPRENEGNDDSSNENETKRIIKPKKRVTRPILKLDHTRLVGSRGISVIESSFKDIKFKGKGHELEDLNKILRTLEHWALRLFPKMAFEDCISKIEDLGLKKNVMVHVTKIRLGMEDPEIPIIPEVENNEVVDPFDELISNNVRPPQTVTLTEEQRARMMRNRLIAEEIRMKKMEARQKQLAEEAERMESANMEVSESDVPEKDQEETSNQTM